jgi:hypothetical protein
VPKRPAAKRQKKRGQKNRGEAAKKKKLIRFGLSDLGSLNIKKSSLKSF